MFVGVDEVLFLNSHLSFLQMGFINCEYAVVSHQYLPIIPYDTDDYKNFIFCVEGALVVLSLCGCSCFCQSFVFMCMIGFVITHVTG